MKKVSIVIPTFNQAAYLPACVDHCIHQTYTELEMIIVDGGSSDTTKAYLAGLKNDIVSARCNPVQSMDENGTIIRKEVARYPQGRCLKVITFDRDIGATKTYNEGLKVASGEYCTYIVGDDMPHPHMIEEMVNTLESTGVDFVYSDMNVVDDSGRIVRQMQMPDYSFERCFAQWYHLGVSHLYRTVWHKTVGLMDEGYTAANDYDHYLRFAMAGARFCHLPRVLYSVRHHGESRKTGQHSDVRYQTLLDESRACARRARAWLAENESPMGGRATR